MPDYAARARSAPNFLQKAVTWADAREKVVVAIAAYQERPGVGPGPYCVA